MLKKFLIKSEIIPNGVSFENRTDSNYESKLIGSPLFLTVGSLTKRKGQKHFIKIMPKLLEKYPKSHYHCVGKPLLLSELKNLVKRLGIVDSISFHGIIDDLALESFYRQADIFIMLSENQPDGDVEGFGISILEANYFSTPAIGSDNCGISDAINKKTGILVQFDSEEKIISAVDKIIENLESYSYEARKWAKLHSWQFIGDQYEKVLFDE